MGTGKGAPDARMKVRAKGGQATPDGQRIFRGTMFVMLSRVTSMAAMLVFSIIMARSLGRDVYGLISIAIGVFGIATIVGDLGLNVASTRYTAIHRKKGERGEIIAILRASILIKVVSGVALMFVLWLVSPGLEDVFDKPVGRLISLMALAIVFNMPASAFQAIIRGHHRLDLYAGCNMVRDITWLTSSVILVQVGYGVEGAIIGHVIGQIAWFVSNVISYFVFLHVQATPKDIQKTAKKLILFGLPVITVDVMIFVYSWTDTFVIGIFRPTAEVSTYNIAFGMISMIMVFIGSVSTTVFPIISERSIRKDPVELTEHYNRLTRIVSMVVFPVLSFLVFVQPFVFLVYGKEYLAGVAVLWILAVWGYFRPFGNMSATMLTALGRQRYVLYATTFVALANLGLNLALVPWIGMIGAAVASTISICAGTVLSVRYLERLEGVRPDVRTPVKMLALSVGAVIPFSLLLHGVDILFSFTSSLAALVLVLAAVCLAYLAVFLWLARRLRLLDDDDVRILREATARIPLADRIIDVLL
jgi:O-antigen/teichoic acid export membrane protein